MKPHRLQIAVTVGEVHHPGLTEAEKFDHAQLVAALQAAHARDHDLVQQLEHAANVIAEGRAALEHTTGLLQTRTIERDHYAQDGHLWALCLAWLVKQEPDEELALPSDDVNAMEGLMLSANVVDGHVRITVNERPAASQEGGGNGG